MKPKILLVADDGYQNNIYHYIINSCYGQAISNAGGLPLVALSESITNDYFNLCDGIFIADGAFVHASNYGGIYEVNKELPELSRKREIMDFTLLELAVKNKKPIIAIGRGLCFINAYFGGTLKIENDKQVIDKLSENLTVDNGVYQHKTLPITAIDCTSNKLSDYQQNVCSFISACKGGIL